MGLLREPDHWSNPPTGRLIVKSADPAQEIVSTTTRTEQRDPTYYPFWLPEKNPASSHVHRVLGPGAKFALAQRAHAGCLPDNARIYTHDPNGSAQCPIKTGFL